MCAELASPFSVASIDRVQEHRVLKALAELHVYDIRLTSILVRAGSEVQLQPLGIDVICPNHSEHLDKVDKTYQGQALD